MLGITQYSSWLFLLKNLIEGLLFGDITATLYLLAVIQWTKELKSTVSISSSYAIAALGAFAVILTIHSLKLHDASIIAIQDIAGIVF